MTFCSQVDGRGSDLRSLRQLQDATGLLSTPLQNHWRPFSPFFFLSLTSSRLSLALQDLVIKSWGEPTSSEGQFPDIVDLGKKRQYTPLKTETVTDFKRRNLSWKQYTTPPEPICGD